MHNFLTRIMLDENGQQRVFDLALLRHHYCKNGPGFSGYHHHIPVNDYIILGKGHDKVLFQEQPQYMIIHRLIVAKATYQAFPV